MLVGLTVGVFFAFKAVGAPESPAAAAWLLTVEIAQGAVGFTQYFTDLPVGLVEVHLLGAALVSATATWVVLGVRDRSAPRSDVPHAMTRQMSDRADEGTAYPSDRLGRHPQ